MKTRHSGKESNHSVINYTSNIKKGSSSVSIKKKSFSNSWTYPLYKTGWGIPIVLYFGPDNLFITLEIVRLSFSVIKELPFD